MALEAGDRFPVDRSLRQRLQSHKKNAPDRKIRGVFYCRG
ncbi:hypothetical protein C4K09_5613 [Pseudomonas chlororaphis subsp. aureofaciens]|nr:hypothetical protein C4K09_5613 [Pseudomonas chlororaphis subsp. aureofaciens]